jgi:hypothetical protein
MATLLNTYQDKLRQTDNKFVRYLMPQINWNNRLFAVIGAQHGQNNAYVAIYQAKF